MHVKKVIWRRNEVFDIDYVKTFMISHSLYDEHAILNANYLLYNFLFHHDICHNPTALTGPIVVSYSDTDIPSNGFGKWILQRAVCNVDFSPSYDDHMAVRLDANYDKYEIDYWNGNSLPRQTYEYSRFAVSYFIESDPNIHYFACCTTVGEEIFKAHHMMQDSTYHDIGGEVVELDHSWRNKTYEIGTYEQQASVIHWK